MTQPQTRQSEFVFETNADASNIWRQRREQDLSALARRVGLPIGHQAEVWLAGGIRLRGLLELELDTMFLSDEKATALELRIEGVTFRVAEMESCVRTD
jgi:hypothetical protein